MIVVVVVVCLFVCLFVDLFTFSETSSTVCLLF